jgi:hypothetical protein
MFEKSQFESENNFNLQKKLTKEKFSGPPLPGFVRLAVYPPSELALSEIDVNKGYHPLIVGDFEIDEIKTKFGNKLSGNYFAVSWDEFKRSCLPIDTDAPNEAAITKYFFYEQDNKHIKNNIF